MPTSARIPPGSPGPGINRTWSGRIYNPPLQIYALPFPLVGAHYICALQTFPAALSHQISARFFDSLVFSVDCGMELPELGQGVGFLLHVQQLHQDGVGDHKALGGQPPAAALGLLCQIPLGIGGQQLLQGRELFATPNGDIDAYLMELFVTGKYNLEKE